MLFNYTRHAGKMSYKNGYKRRLKDIKGIVIHYTGGSKDTAKNECDYFATQKSRYAGAHIFIDKKGKAGKSINLNEVAWSVGDKANGRGKLFHVLNNTNTVSIELCGLGNGKMSKDQHDKLVRVVKWLAKKCPNVKYICRHYDITTKQCPLYYVKHDNDWSNLKKELSKYI